MAFAQVSDIEARWRDLDETEEARASVLIDDASAILSSLVTVVDGDTAQAANLKTVCCNMVIRAMSATESDIFGVSSSSVTAGPYAETVSYANPSGDMYLTKMEKRILGITTSYIGTIFPLIDGYYDAGD